MSHLKIVCVRGQGDQRAEYVTLRVQQDCNLSHYALVDSTFTKANTVSNLHRHFYRFPPINVKRGAYVHLFTRQGCDQTVRGSNGVLHHRCYWGLNSPVWNDRGDVAVLLQVADLMAASSV